MLCFDVITYFNSINLLCAFTYLLFGAEYSVVVKVYPSQLKVTGFHPF